ncbi:MAG: hypothetical protein ABIC91_02225 [Nanoarchaeota archaeon]|nr:hypothetical protein [Nanoarchaeota archaeon]MBU1030144.1 hypothetical protein [Nanoarchaeota archaeon]MBU1850420.1 hypothetical protein [Nanoarchaeota archaeon]
MAKKKSNKNKISNKQSLVQVEKASVEKISPKEQKRKKITKYGFYIIWALWFIGMIPFYLPHSCAALFDPFECPVISAFISVVLGSLFCAFITWIVFWIIVWLYFYHKELTWKNIKNFFKD